MKMALPPVNEKKIKVVFFQRKVDPSWNHSIEFIFSDVRSRLQSQIDGEVFYSTYFSRGVFKRLYNCWEAFLHQGDVNHVTGDIHYLGAFLKKRKTIHTIHDCVFLKTSTGLKRSILKYFWLSMPVRRSRFITTVSTASKTEILQHCHCAPDKIIVIPVAISDRYKRAEKVFNEGSPLILLIGTAPNKNIPRAIAALKGIPCRLDIIGKHNAGYEQLLQESGLEYTYRTSVSDMEMEQAYRQADMLLFASTYEGFGMPILEAQAIGRPVITSNLASMPEVAGEAACLVDPCNEDDIRQAVLRLVHDRPYREALVSRGFENIKRYGSDHIAQQYLNLYHEIAGIPAG